MKFQEFVNWALAQGSVAKTNGEYLGECVSLINQYCHKVLGVPAGAWGHAKDWAYNAMPMKYFDKVSGPQEGDILVYGSNFGGGYGHIEIVLNDKESIFQNRNNSRRVGYGQRLGGYSAILRLKPEYRKQEPPKYEPPKFVPMDNPRVMIASTGLHKFDPDTKTFSSEVSLPKGDYRLFLSKVIVDGKTYVRTEHDHVNNNRRGFLLDNLIDLPDPSDVVKRLKNL